MYRHFPIRFRLCHYDANSDANRISKCLVTRAAYLPNRLSLQNEQYRKLMKLCSGTEISKIPKNSVTHFDLRMVRIFLKIFLRMLEYFYKQQWYTSNETWKTVQRNEKIFLSSEQGKSREQIVVRHLEPIYSQPNRGKQSLRGLQCSKLFAMTVVSWIIIIVYTLANHSVLR